ncbi:MAG TPA: hypothetical protein VIY52_09740 [Streptosporangiaceae bacterium]
MPDLVEGPAGGIGELVRVGDVRMGERLGGLGENLLGPAVGQAGSPGDAASRARDEFRRAPAMTRNECERALLLRPGGDT